MIKIARSYALATVDDAIDVNLELINTRTGKQKRVVVVKDYYAIAGMVERFARQQRISPWAVEVHVTS